MRAALNASSLRVHFANYHSRFPLISGVAADQSAIDDAAAIGASGPTDVERIVALGTLSNETSWIAEYPEDIQILGASFNSVLPVVGTLVGVEVSHHFNWPVQIARDLVIETALSPIHRSETGTQRVRSAPTRSPPESTRPSWPWASHRPSVRYSGLRSRCSGST